MQEIDDARWREAARMMRLDLVDADGAVLPDEQGTQADAMRGQFEGYRVRVRYGLRDANDRITVLEIELGRKLLLGLETQMYLDPRPRNNHYGVVRRPVFSGSRSIDDQRTRVLFGETSQGRELWVRLQQLGALGWVELTDSHLRVHAEVFVDMARGWVDLLRSAVQVARLAETAREELPELPWETRLRERLEAQQERLHLELDRRALRLSGRIDSVTVSVRLAVADGRYALMYSAGVSPGLPKGEKLVSRAPMSFLTKVLRFGRSTSGSWEDSIEASPLVRGRLSEKQLDRIATLAKLGHVKGEGGSLTLRCFDVEVEPAQILGDLAGVASALASASFAPYRG